MVTLFIVVRINYVGLSMEREIRLHRTAYVLNPRIVKSQLMILQKIVCFLYLSDSFIPTYEYKKNGDDF